MLIYFTWQLLQSVLWSSFLFILFKSHGVLLYVYHVFGFRFGLTAVYLLAIQYFTKIGGKISIRLIKYENNENTEYRADSLVYKVWLESGCHSVFFFLVRNLFFFWRIQFIFQVFGLYFMQSYIGVFYHALLHRNFMTLRQVLIQRLILSEVKIIEIHYFLLTPYNFLDLSAFELQNAI